MRLLLCIFGFHCFLSILAETRHDPNAVKKKQTKDGDNIEEFAPTHEWQTIKEGQVIPKGLHIRINLETGKKEAKLLQDSQQIERTDVVSVSVESIEEDNINENHAKAIKDSLLKLEKEDEENAADLIREKFRSYKELKKAFNELNMTVKTDLEIMTELINKFKNLQRKLFKSSEEMLSILNDLEYLVHQFDNALEFIKLEGISDIVLPMLNSTDSKLRAEAAHLLGSAAQSNVKVQISGLENGVINSLLRTIWLDPDSTVQVRSLYAISCLIRNFPAAQKTFVKDGGLSVLAQVFEKGKENHKLQVKIITLLNDLLLERQDALLQISEATANKTELQMKVDQYKAAGLEETFVEHGWCTRTAEVLLAQDQTWNRAKKREDLTSALTDLPVRPEHDFVEKIANALLAMADICHAEFRNNLDLKTMITGLKQWYFELSLKENYIKHVKYGESFETNDEYIYYSGIANVFEKLNEKLERSNIRDEL